MQLFPWKDAMAIAFGVLGMGSREFWSMTPGEFRALTRGLYGTECEDGVITRLEFEKLRECFPDAGE